MKPIIFHLFRLKVLYPMQMDFITEGVERAPLLRRLIESCPSETSTRGTKWLIGDVIIIDDETIYFKIGRVKDDEIEQYDDKIKHFETEEATNYPSTHAILFITNGVLAIAHRYKLAQHTRQIASQLAMILRKSAEFTKNKLGIHIEEMYDPKQFLEYLRTAFSINQFTFSFTGPNPDDVDACYHSFEVLTLAANGEKGSTTLTGESLKKDVLEELTNTSASLGHEVSASMKSTEFSTPVVRKSGENPVTKSVGDELLKDFSNESLSILKMLIHERYTEIRGIQKQ